MAKAPQNVVSHWNVLIRGLQVSPMEFYGALEQALESRQIPEADRSRIDWHEAGPFSAKREYLRVRRQEFAVDVCGAPFGDGFFVSEWGGEFRRGPLALFLILIGMFFLYLLLARIFGGFFGTVLAFVAIPTALWYLARNAPAALRGWDDPLVLMPVLGGFYRAVFRPATYYNVDTANMFWAAAHSAVQETIDQLSEAHGIRALSADERKPTMRAFWER